jgi:hypothetical protein
VGVLRADALHRGNVRALESDVVLAFRSHERYHRGTNRSSRKHGTCTLRGRNEGERDRQRRPVAINIDAFIFCDTERAQKVRAIA